MLNGFRTTAGRLAAAVLGLATLAFVPDGAARAAPAPYPERVPLEQYRIANRADEIALARSAAPPAIAAHAEVRVLGARGYETAAKGDNGFVCLVLRAWADGFDDPEFWNPRPRSPICYNAAAARSVMPTDLRRAEWALAGISRAEMVTRTKAAIASHAITAPEVGAMSYMLSKSGYLNDKAGHWRPHLMFFLPRMAPGEWGADAPGGAVMADAGALEPLTVFFVPVAQWSDGTPAEPMKM